MWWLVDRLIAHRLIACRGAAVVFEQIMELVVAIWCCRSLEECVQMTCAREMMLVPLWMVGCAYQLRTSLILAARDAVAKCLRSATTLLTPWARVVHFANSMCIDGHALHYAAATAAADAAAAAAALVGS